MISGRQIRAARGLLDMSQDDLAQSAGLTPQAIRKIEDGAVQPREGTIADITRVFDERGLEFIDHEGVQLRDNTIVIIDGPDFYLRLLDEVYHAARQSPLKEVCFINVDDNLSPPEVVESNRRIREIAHCRYLCEEKATRFDFPLKDYREIPQRFFYNTVQIIFADRVATLLKQQQSVLIVRSIELAESMRRLFAMVWTTSKMPKDISESHV